MTPLNRFYTAIAGLLVAAALFGCGRSSPKARFLRQIDWLEHGQWLKADLHAHTKFSDGAHTVGEVIEKAAAFGCRVVAITDHSDRNLAAATRNYFEAIEAARKLHPELIILAGVEWNLPPFGGKQHANVFLASEENEGPLLAEFKEKFDDLDRKDEGFALADEALQWLNSHGAAAGMLPVVIYNHPSRKRESSTDLVEEIAHLRERSPIIAALEGGPGHQRYHPLGSYIQQQPLVDRWDPAVARVGDAWDQLLARGIDVWGAATSSDFHNEITAELHDYWPGEFSETWLYVGEPNRHGVLRALQAGTFFGVHGHIAREAKLSVFADALPRPAQAGEHISVPKGTQLRVSVKCKVPTTDWQGAANSLDAMEVIVVDGNKASERSVPVSAGNDTVETTLQPVSNSVVIRARGRRKVPGGPDLMFYTNPVRVTIE